MDCPQSRLPVVITADQTLDDAKQAFLPVLQGLRIPDWQKVGISLISRCCHYRAVYEA